jgi:hypothetical protein
MIPSSIQTCTELLFYKSEVEDKIQQLRLIEFKMQETWIKIKYSSWLIYWSWRGKFK